MKSSSVIACALGAAGLCVASTASAALVQWRVEDGGNGSYYGLTSAATNWDTAQAEAAALGGTLACISSAAENAFVASLLPSAAGGPNTAAWIGLFRTAAGPWQWVDGSALSYLNWAGGEPNNALGNEFYGMMYGPAWPSWTPNPFGGWNDHNQTSFALFGLIEVVPAPGALAVLGAVGLIGARRARAV